jgi:hypothetical protein
MSSGEGSWAGGAGGELWLVATRCGCWAGPRETAAGGGACACSLALVERNREGARRTGWYGNRLVAGLAVEAGLRVGPCLSLAC